MAVVFPAPFCPSKANSSPERTCKSTPFSAVTVPNRLRTSISSAQHSCFMVPPGSGDTVDAGRSIEKAFLTNGGSQLTKRGKEGTRIEVRSEGIGGPSAQFFLISAPGLQLHTISKSQHKLSVNPGLKIFNAPD